MQREKRRRSPGVLLVMALCLVGLMLTVPASAQPDAMRVTLNLQNVTVKQFFDDVKKQTGLSFIYSTEQNKLLKPISIQCDNRPVKRVLDQVLGVGAYTYNAEGNIVTLTLQVAKGTDVEHARVLHGVVMDDRETPLPGANIYVKGNQHYYAISDIDGRFSITIPVEACTVTFSYIGMKPFELALKKGENAIQQNIVLQNDTEMEEVVVTGIFTRKAESFTGSAVTVTSKDLMRVSNQNLFQSLKNLDPTVYIADNLAMGSDPNTVPTMSMRGTSSFPAGTSELKSSYQNDPNQPLFILDGFETTAERIMDMDMNRVESLTILKDASAKALYGSKAANGVIVIETKRLVGNETRVTYNGNLTLEMPDLTSYDMCNALEKLQVEMAEGIYTDADITTQAELTARYNARKKLALEGLNTDWLSKPLHTGVGHKHNLNVELGDSRSLRAYLDFTYNEVNGVMKGSQRKNISGDINISFRKNNFLFKNILSLTSNESTDSPYGTFSDYVKMNPYWQATDEKGNILRWAETGLDEISTGRVANPLYDATIGTSFTSTYTSFTNNFYTEWTITPDWKATLRLGVSQQRNDADNFYPADHSEFADIIANEQKAMRGRYIAEYGKRSSISGDFNINYNKTFGKHSVFGNAGFFMSEEEYSTQQYKAEGFANALAADIAFAKQYAEGETPISEASINREASFLLSASYDYDGRYLADATVRESASSLYGADKRWANSWSFGLGWNLHNEAFLKNIDWIELLKLRASVGLTGNQNFNTSAAIATYKYFAGVLYEGQMGSYLYNMPNPGLMWEQKKDYNVGIDLRLAGISLSVDVFKADTKNMLTSVTIPTSTGFGTVMDNLGLVRNSGVEAKLNYTAWQGKEGFVSLHGTFAYTKNKIVSLSESMRSYNEKMLQQAEDAQTSAPVLMYQDGLSMNTIWAVPSAGIDPQSGKEVYIKKDGTYTYTYDSADMIAAGDATPKYRGTAGFTAEYKGIGLSATLSYLAGCQMYNNTLVDRVENADLLYNVDHRVLLGRWQKPGDVTPYKGFKADEATRATTRFVQDRNELSISSISAYYEMPESIYRKLHMKRLRAAVYLNNVATFSSIKVERGTSYPFARTLSFSLTGTF